MRRGWLIAIAACSAAPTPQPRAMRSPLDAAVAPPCDDSPPTSAELIVRVEHGACDGRCPVYDVSVFRDGTVDYFGLVNVGVAGQRVTHVDSGVLAQLELRVHAVDLAALPRDPNSFAAGSWVGTVEHGGAIAYVDFTDPQRLPAPVTALVDQLDALVGVERGRATCGRTRGR